MQAIAKDKKGPANPETQAESAADDRLNRMADKMAERGLKEERDDDEGLIVESDPHGSTV